MKKFILGLVLLLVVASSSAPSAVACPQDDIKGKAEVIADSIRSLGDQVGQKVSEGVQWIADSAAIQGQRLGQQMSVQADTLVQRSIRAWRVLTGKDQKQQKDE